MSSATELNFQTINDVSFKPSLLLHLLSKFVPEEKRPFDNPSDLEHVLSTVQTFRLLSESAPPSTDQHVIDSWKSAVDLWVNRLLTLSSTTSPDKCLAGVSLLGVTCGECSSERFIASYADWFNKLIKYIQSPADTQILKVASCASLSDLLKRLSRYPNEKKDGHSQATKLIQPALKLLNEDSSEVVWEEAICLLSTIITTFPSSIQRDYDSVEAAVVSKLMSEKCSDILSKKLGYVLSLLPKSRGDSESWILMMQKILISIDSQLEDGFQSLENESRRNKVKNLLLPPGKERPLPLGGKAVQGVYSMLRPELVFLSRISTLMGCCCQLLTNSYPVQVSVPVRALVALVERVLLVDGSSLHGQYSILSKIAICSKLPLLHLYSLELLSSIIQGLRSLLLPHVADIIRLLTVYTKGCKLPELRIKVYQIYKDLLRSVGVGIVVNLANVITSNADLGSFDLENGVPSSNVNAASAEAPLQPHQKKRKHAVTVSAQSDRIKLDEDPALNLTTLSARIAALEALEALLITGGSFRSKDWRSNIDSLLAKVAIDACKDGFMKEEQFPFDLTKDSSPRDGFQLAALRAFLASLVSPGLSRPLYLAHGLELFRRGSREGGARIANFCTHSLMTLEVLIHPKSLPLVDFDNSDTNRDFPDNTFFNGYARKPVYHSSMLENGQNEPEPDFIDPLQSFLEREDEMETRAIPPPCYHAEDGTKLGGSEPVVSPAAFTKGSSEVNYSSKGDTTKTSFEVNYSSKGETTSLVSGCETTVSFEAVQSRNEDASRLSDDMETENNVGYASAASKMVNDSLTGNNKESGIEMEVQSDTDSIPDIVDGDPDSD